MRIKVDVSDWWVQAALDRAIDEIEAWDDETGAKEDALLKAPVVSKHDGVCRHICPDVHKSQEKIGQAVQQLGIKVGLDDGVHHAVFKAADSPTVLK